MLINKYKAILITGSGGLVGSEAARFFHAKGYRIIGIGFPLLTIGILSGAVWANEAWGSYWSWDPKETWAFITWLIFAFYLHTRLQYGWEGKKSAFVATFGFFILWICYLGVNLLGKGLHSYGWLS
jgi:cytochrome c-type biogenesis protein CcsB